MNAQGQRQATAARCYSMAGPPFPEHRRTLSIPAQESRPPFVTISDRTACGQRVSPQGAEVASYIFMTRNDAQYRRSLTNFPMPDRLERYWATPGSSLFNGPSCK